MSGMLKQRIELELILQEFLTSKGRRQSVLVGKLIGQLNYPGKTLVLHSPYLRAKETAELLLTNSGLAVDLLEDVRLGCGMRIEAAADVINELNFCDSLVMVGHQPDFGELFSYLLGGSSGGYMFKKASVAVFQLERFGYGRGVLEAFIPVKVLKYKFRKL